MRKLVAFVATAVILLAVVLNSFVVVDSTERAALITFGEVKGTFEPGFHGKAPFISKVRKFDITPSQYKNSMSVGQDGAITSDKQTIGIEYELYWRFKESDIEEVAKKYSKVSIIEKQISTTLKEIIKDETGKISIAQFINTQSEVSARILSKLTQRIDYVPVEVTSFSITNLDWSDDYDSAIKETARIAQQIERAKNEAEVTAANAQKLVKEAEAKKQAAELDAQANIARAEGEAKAKMIKTDADAYEARQIALNRASYEAQWRYEIDLERAKRWNGKEVSDQAVYVPNTFEMKK